MNLGEFLHQSISLTYNELYNLNGIVNSWNPALLPDDNKTFSENVANGKQALPPCHYYFQFYVNDDKLSLKLNMRSNDLFLGNPFNIAQYSILLHMIAQVTKLKPGEFIYSGGDIHIYLNHIEQCKEQLTRSPYPSPKLLLNKKIDNIDDFKFDDFKFDDFKFDDFKFDDFKFDDFKFDDFEIIDYEHHPAIKGEVSI